MLIQKKPTSRIAFILLCGFLALSMSSCARSSNPDVGLKTTEINDPIEPLNRAVFALNNFIDMVLIEPAAKVYTAALPNFARNGVQNFMRNLKSPIIVANDLLQGNIGNAGVATARFFINTTAGIAGLVDVASTQGLSYTSEDFGQTLAVWGFRDGFYLVLPLIGPSSLRDTVGMTADAYADPLRIWSFKTGHDWIYYTRNGVESFDNRARIVKAVEDLRRNSIDYYAAVRSAYTQKRGSDIHNQSAQSTPEIPDYDGSK
jgi:phospholipid-binding lipoprotein MlaA